MISAPISNGELIDKITILEIKVARGIKSAQKELDFLLELYNKQEWSKSLIIKNLKDTLYIINNSLWDIEDGKRLCEKNQNFDSHFVELARVVYIMNDNRAMIKKQINQYSKSEIFEYKSY